jgi:hypothetical protein
LQYFLQKLLVQTALQDSAALVRKVNFYLYFSSLNKHGRSGKKINAVDTNIVPLSL